MSAGEGAFLVLIVAAAFAFVAVLARQSGRNP